LRLPCFFFFALLRFWPITILPKQIFRIWQGGTWNPQLHSFTEKSVVMMLVVTYVQLIR
jgi:hypothetical protein